MRASEDGKCRPAGGDQFSHWYGTGVAMENCFRKCAPTVAVPLVLPQKGALKVHSPVVPQLQTAEIVEHSHPAAGEYFQPFLRQRLVSIGNIGHGSRGAILKLQGGNHIVVTIKAS